MGGGGRLAHPGSAGGRSAGLRARAAGHARRDAGLSGLGSEHGAQLAVLDGADVARCPAHDPRVRPALPGAAEHDAARCSAVGRGGDVDGGGSSKVARPAGSGTLRSIGWVMALVSVTWALASAADSPLSTRALVSRTGRSGRAEAAIRVT